MIIKDEKGNELLEVLNIDEALAEKMYRPVNHALAIVKVGDEYLMGWNRWREDWEIFGGCKEDGETLRECIVRECNEELGLEHVDYTFLGLMHLKMAPGYFNPEWHEEYGGLYGVSLPKNMMGKIELHRRDYEEVEKVEFYSRLNEGDKVAVIDEKLLDYWK